MLSSKIFPLIKRRKLSPNLSGNHESRLISRVTRHCRCQEPRFSGECVYQSRKNYGGNHGRPENKGLGAANEPSLFCTSFMKFRGPEALKDRRDEKAGLRGMRYAPNVRRAKGIRKRRPAMQKISTMRAGGSRVFKGRQLTIGLDLGDR